MQKMSLEEFWDYRDSKLYPELFGLNKNIIYTLEPKLFRNIFNIENIDPTWLSVGVFAFEPTRKRDTFLYVSAGLSTIFIHPEEDFNKIKEKEFIIETKEKSDWALHFIGKMCAYEILLRTGHFRGNPPIEIGHRIPIKNNIHENSKISSMLAFDSFYNRKNSEIEFIQFFGITDSELRYAQKHNNENLIRMLRKKTNFPIFEPLRDSVI